MSVIHTKMKMPVVCEDCTLANDECFGSWKCTDAKDWGTETTRPKDCPLKSIDGLIEQINSEICSPNYYCSEIVTACKIINIIKEYCEVTE